MKDVTVTVGTVACRDLYENQLASLPPELFANLPQLQTLYVSCYCDLHPLAMLLLLCVE